VHLEIVRLDTPERGELTPPDELVLYLPDAGSRQDALIVTSWIYYPLVRRPTSSTSRSGTRERCRSGWHVNRDSPPSEKR
jgi:hypothetical protein